MTSISIKSACVGNNFAIQIRVRGTFFLSLSSDLFSRLSCWWWWWWRWWCVVVPFLSFFFYQYLWLYSNLFMYSISRKYYVDIFVLYSLNSIRRVLFVHIFIFIYISNMSIVKKWTNFMEIFSMVNFAGLHIASMDSHRLPIELIWLFICLELLTTLLRITFGKNFVWRWPQQQQNSETIIIKNKLFSHANKQSEKKTIVKCNTSFPFKSIDAEKYVDNLIPSSGINNNILFWQQFRCASAKKKKTRKRRVLIQFWLQLSWHAAIDVCLCSSLSSLSMAIAEKNNIIMTSRLCV